MPVDNGNERRPAKVLLRVGMTDFDMSMVPSGHKLKNKDRAAAQILAQNGMGITKLEEKNGMSLHVEHSSEISGVPIIRAMGYLATQSLGRDIEFIKQDGSPHYVQMEQPDTGDPA